jgi:hypothetical protein
MNFEQAESSRHRFNDYCALFVVNIPAINAQMPPGTVRLGDRSGENKSIIRIFALSILIWAFDYKAGSSGAAAGLQGTILIVFIVASFLLTIFSAWRGVTPGPLWVLILVTMVFLIDSSIVGLSRGQPGYAIFVNLIPSFVYICAGAVTFVTLRTVEDKNSFLDVIRLACVIFGAAHVLIAILTRGAINTSVSRYEVLSGATIPSLAIIAIAMVKRLSKFDFLIIVLNLSVALLSVTRTLLVALAVQIASIFIARPSIAFKQSTIKGLSLISFALLIVLVLDYGSGTGLVDRWVQRLTLSQKVGADPTALTRTAETHFMLQAFESSAESTLFGNGLAALTSLTGPDAAAVARMVGREVVSLHSIGFGHESYVSILFVAGILGGGGLLLLQVLNGFQSFALIRKVENDNSKDNPAAARIGLWGALIVIGELVVGLFGGTMADRDTCLWFGIGTGMLYWARYSLRVTTAEYAKNVLTER